MGPRPQVFQGVDDYVPGPVGPVVTIGNFDGVHRGHRVLLDATRALAAELQAPSCVLTFDPAPRDVLRPDNGIPRIQRLRDKLASLGQAGIDQVVVQPFTRQLAAHSPEDFARHFLAGGLRVQGLVVGWDFRFGKARRGTVDDLRRLLSVPVRQVRALSEDGEVVSSSRIREAVRAGDVALAAELLGRPHEVVGSVIGGDRRGRTLGFPTANLSPETPLLPAHGVYAARAHGPDLDGRAAVVNYGVRPTVSGDDARFEVHVLDWDGDLYDQTLRVALVQRLRGEASFSDLEALKAQIAADVAATRQVLAS